MKNIFKKVKAVFTLSIAFLLTSCAFTASKNLHGAELAELPDEQLFETVYLQTIDLVLSYPDEEIAFSKISPEQRTVYILSIYDMEIQNGGLCQFFVNSSRSLAPYVEENLSIVGAGEHKKLFSEFIASNNIDLYNLDSFIISDLSEYASQAKRYDFDSFDCKYIESKPLQSYITNYIRANVEKF